MNIAANHQLAQEFALLDKTQWLEIDL